MDNADLQNQQYDDLLQLFNSPPRSDVLFFSITGGIDTNRNYQAALNIHFTDQPDEDTLGFNISWKITSRRINSSSSTERKFSLTKQLCFKATSNAEAGEYQPIELSLLFQRDVLAYAKYL